MKNHSLPLKTIKKALFLILLLSGTVIAQEYIGDQKTKVAYGFKCAEANTITLAAFFQTKEQVAAKGYSLSSQCTKLKAKPAPKTEAAPAAKAAPLKLIAVTSDPRQYLGKVVTVEGWIEIDDIYHHGNNNYSFEIHDRSAFLLVYCPKSECQWLRNQILNLPDNGRLVGQFKFVLDPRSLARSSFTLWGILSDARGSR